MTGRKRAPWREVPLPLPADDLVLVAQVYDHQAADELPPAPADPLEGDQLPLFP